MTMIHIFTIKGFKNQQIVSSFMITKYWKLVSTLDTSLFILQGGPKKTLLLSGFEFLTLGEVFLGVVFHQKLIGDGLRCPTCVLHVENTCFLPIIHLFLHVKYVFLHPKNITFVRIWVFGVGRGIIRDNFPSEIDWWWSHMPHTCLPCGKHMFCG